MDAIKLAAALDHAIEHDLPVMIWGTNGIGKTQIAMQAAARADRDCYVLMPSTYESVDFRGIPNDNGAGGVAWSRPDFLVALDNMRPGAILFIDEANTNKAIETVLMQLVLTRRVGPHALPDGTRIVMAGNRVSDGAAAQKMNKALEDRLFHLDLEASLDAWLKWGATNGMHPALLAFLMLRGKDAPNRPGCFISRDKGTMDQRSRPGPRAWADVSRVIDAPDSIRFAFVAGRVGEAAAAELDGFLHVWRNLVPIPQIIAKPDTAPVPADSDLSVKYAVSVALGHAANAANLGAIARYMARVGKEFLTVTMTDAVRRNSNIAQTPAYITWAAANADIAI